MRFLKFLLLAVLLACLLVVSGLGTLIYLPAIPGTSAAREPARLIIEEWTKGGTLFFAFVGMFILTLLYIILSVMSYRSKPVVTIDTDRGKVHIIDSAVRKYLFSTLNKMPSIQVRSIQVSGSKKGLQVIVFVRVRSVSHLNDVKETIIERMRNALEKELGVPTIGKLEVIVDDFEAVRVSKQHAPATDNADPIPTATLPAATTEPAPEADTVPTAETSCPENNPDGFDLTFGNGTIVVENADELLEDKKE